MKCPYYTTDVNFKQYRAYAKRWDEIKLSNHPVTNPEDFWYTKQAEEYPNFIKDVVHTPFVKCEGTIQYVPIDMSDVCCPEPGDLHMEFKCDTCGNDVTIDYNKYPQLNIDPVKIVTKILEEIE